VNIPLTDIPENLTGASSQVEYADAEPLFGRALTIRELYLSANHPDISESLHDYGWLLYKTNREHEGQKLCVSNNCSVLKAVDHRMRIEKRKLSGILICGSGIGARLLK
jgi:hypothetical protein